MICSCRLDQTVFRVFSVVIKGHDGEKGHPEEFMCLLASWPAIRIPLQQEVGISMLKTALFVGDVQPLTEWTEAL